MALKIENYGKSMGKFLNRFGAALIDMDGVLYDSMKWHTLAWKKMMESVGVECDRDEFYLYEGMTGEDRPAVPSCVRPRSHIRAGEGALCR